MGITDYIDQETIDRLMEAVKILVDEVTRIMRNLAEQLAVDLKPVIDAWVAEFNNYCSCYPNKKVVFLAFHAKKARVRNKNHNRLMNDFLKYLQEGCDEDE